LGGSVLEGIDGASNHIVFQRAVLGARSNRLEVAQDRAFTSNINLTEMLSKLEDVDWAEASMNFATAAAVYNAALATGAQVIQPTLLDYLR
jgi:flagellar hook-associated protein 3 FlgL